LLCLFSGQEVWMCDNSKWFVCCRMTKAGQVKTPPTHGKENLLNYWTIWLIRLTFNFTKPYLTFCFIHLLMIWLPKTYHWKVRLSPCSSIWPKLLLYIINLHSSIWEHWLKCFTE
jgi:hypothetical protein